MRMNICKNVCKWTEVLQSVTQGSVLASFFLLRILIIYFSWLILQKYVILRMTPDSLPVTENPSEID